MRTAEIPILLRRRATVVATPKNITNVQVWATANLGAASSVAIALGAKVIAGNLLVAYTRHDDTTASHAISDDSGDGVSWNDLGSCFQTGLVREHIWWKQVGAVSGPTPTTITMTSGTSGSIRISAAEYTPSATATFSLNGTPVFVSNQTGANPNAGNILLTHKGLIVAFANDADGFPTAGSGGGGYTRQLTWLAGGFVAVEDQFPSAGATIATDWVEAGTGAYSAMGAAFKAI